jgi:hypothetical protein
VLGQGQQSDALKKSPGMLGLDGLPPGAAPAQRTNFGPLWAHWQTALQMTFRPSKTAKLKHQSKRHQTIVK